ncbi:Hypothetical predicted protein [Olea europaea subsp. europaea]|uniref:Uncharacterized protein n=1 Tax=Olea europaea subsp. europaea TaxID=158383 RepID=A0A8S0TDL0_OLEEU|nr:Hypothetical predicted protein [Olea europaea subsp. europaea]
MNAVRNEGVFFAVGEVKDDDLQYPSSDDLQCPSSDELLLACSLDEEVAYCFLEFLANLDTRNPQFEFKTDPNWKTKFNLKTKISRNVANKMRHYAKELLFGTLEEQFGLLRRYVVEEWFDTKLEPIQLNSSVAVNDRGKMVSSRGCGLSLIEIPNAQEPMRFIPTPMVARDTGRSGPTTSALANWL